MKSLKRSKIDLRKDCEWAFYIERPGRSSLVLISMEEYRKLPDVQANPEDLRHIKVSWIESEEGDFKFRVLPWEPLIEALVRGFVIRDDEREQILLCLKGHESWRCGGNLQLANVEPAEFLEKVSSII